MTARLSTLVLAALLAVTLSGCFGTPHGAAVLSCQASNADGTPVLMPQRFAVDFGTPWGRSFQNRAVNTTVANPASESGHAYCAIVEVPQEFQRTAKLQTYNTTSFTDIVGTPTVGMRFAAFGYNATMTAVDPHLVTFELQPRDGERLEVAQYGLALQHGSDGDELVQTLQPLVGTTFRILQPNQIALPLPVGAYRSLEAQGGHLRFGYVASTDVALLDRALTVSVTVVAVERASLADTPGLYGVRISPQVLGDVTPFLGGRLPSGEPATQEPSDDGHADDGHGHAH